MTLLIVGLVLWVVAHLFIVSGCVALAIPPASVTLPAIVPSMMALSLVPLMVTVTNCVVPSADRKSVV